MSKYKNIFAKGYVPNWSRKVFVIKEFKNTVPWAYVISDLYGEEFARALYVRVEKVIRRKDEKLYVK